ncbi:sugar kinase [Agromyces mangrovi Wang et al. 2018]|uniref:sugar kinase n=1 Tax=Agromyces mangrovi TaxID=1858653 RepID=UPI002572BC75|nr:sugar kinase [Agromyces mangrovi]BDZ64086.1 sugar kinase [Agromyces mangrovi]
MAAGGLAGEGRADAAGPASPVASGRVLTVGEGLAVLRARDIGSLVTVGDLVVGTGGAEGNVAIGLARLGTPVTWLGRVGDDGFGRRVVRELRAEGVDVVAPVDAGAPTGLLVKSTPAAGRTDVAYYRAGSAGSRLEASDLDAVDVAEFALVHVTGITPALSASASGAVDALVARAVAAGVPVSFDVNHRSSLWADADAAAERYRALAAQASVVFAGDDEAALLVGPGSPEELAERLAGLGPAEVVIKLGAEGALVRTGAGAVDGGTRHDGRAADSDGTPQVLRRAAVPVEVVDTVGAGDAFVAGYLAERVAGLPVAARLATAVRTGAAACTHPGDWEGAATRADLAQDVGGDPVRR